MLKVVFISDTHSLARDLVVPDGDVLVHCGDLAGNGRIDELMQQLEWLSRFPHKHKILVAGNHDELFEQWPIIAREETARRGIIYLQDQWITIEGVTFYGTPWQPQFNNWAFNIKEEEKRAQIYAGIPEFTDVLITHCPPLGILDFCQDGHVGCNALWWEVMERVKPSVHAFGHVHEGYGMFVVGSTTFVNASICTGDYNPTNKPIVLTVRPKVTVYSVNLKDFLEPMHVQTGEVEAGAIYFNLIGALVKGSKYAQRRVDFRKS